MLSESITTLPDDVVQCNILPFLSTKSLLRFTCVCKSWHSLIHKPSFLHLRRPTDHFLFVSCDPQASVHETSQPHVFSTPVQPNTTTFPRATLLFTIPNLNFSETRVQCLNGLLCFHPRSNAPFSNQFISDCTVIANPTTRQILTLPVDYSIGHIGEFKVSTHFGYDPVRDQFKVLRLVLYRDNSHEFKVFTLGHDRSWRVITPDTYTRSILLYCLSYYSPMKGRGLCVNGAIHWIYYNSKIVVFDVGMEQFRVMHVPSGYFYGKDNPLFMIFPAFVEIDGCLSLIGYSHSNLMLWILKDKVWEQKNIVLPLNMTRVVSPLCEVSTGKILLLQCFFGRRVGGIYYDMEKMTFTCGVIMEMPQPLPSYKSSGEPNDVFFCQESFRLLK